jgi:hypothetical protein
MLKDSHFKPNTMSVPFLKTNVGFFNWESVLNKSIQLPVKISVNFHHIWRLL